MTHAQAIPDDPQPEGGDTSWSDAGADPVPWLEIAAKAARDNDRAKALGAAGRALQLDWPPRQPAAQGDDGAAGTAQLEDLTLGFLRDAAGPRGAADRTLGVLRALVHLQLDQPEEALQAIDEALGRDADDALLLEGRAWALQRLRQTDKAREVLRECPAEQPEVCAARGWMLIDDRQYEPALAEFKAALAADGRSPTALHGRAAALRLLNRREEAERATRIALRRHPASLPLLNERGWLWLDQGRLDEAAADFDEVLARDHGNVFALVGRARCLRLRCDYAGAGHALACVPPVHRTAAQVQAESALLALARHDDGGGGRAALRESVMAFKGWLEAEPEDPIANAGLGVASWRLRKRREALRFLKKAVRLGDEHPHGAEIRTWLGDLWNECGKLHQAEEQYRAAIERRGDKPQALLRLGELLDATGRRGEAVACFVRSAQGGDPYADLWLGQHYFREAQHDVARKHWTRARSRIEERPAAGGRRLSVDDHYHVACVLLYVEGRSDDAERVLRDGVELARRGHVDAADLWSVLTCLHLERAAARARGPAAHYEQARDAYRHAAAGLAARADRRDTRALVRLAQLHLEIGRTDEARAALGQALARDGDAADVHATFGTLHYRAGDVQAAVEHLERASRCHERDLTVCSQLATALFRAGHAERAEREFDAVLAASPRHVDALIGLGHMHNSLGIERDDPDHYEQAIEHFTTVIDLGAEGSRRLSDVERAAMLYARGFARVKLYECSSAGGEELQLRKAEKDFRRCTALDRGHPMARRARDKIHKRLRRLSSHTLAERVGPVMVAALALAVFGVTQVSLIDHRPMRSLSATMYATLSFGALLFVVAGLYLPRLLRLRIAGMELEKTPVEQKPAPTPLKLNVQALRPPSVPNSPMLLYHGRGMKRVEPTITDWLNRAAHPLHPRGPEPGPRRLRVAQASRGRNKKATPASRKAA
jgi:tetratricopeptide (TPR) repeat protein